MNLSHIFVILYTHKPINSSFIIFQFLSVFLILSKIVFNPKISKGIKSYLLFNFSNILSERFIFLFEIMKFNFLEISLIKVVFHEPSGHSKTIDIQQFCLLKISGIGVVLFFIIIIILVIFVFCT